LIERKDKAAKRAAISLQPLNLSSEEDEEEELPVIEQQLTEIDNEKNQSDVGHGLWSNFTRKFYSFADDIVNAPEVALPQFRKLHFKILDCKRTLMKSDVDPNAVWEEVSYDYVTNVIGVTYAFTRKQSRIDWFTA